jgi:hypothetical protein
MADDEYPEIDCGIEVGSDSVDPATVATTIDSEGTGVGVDVPSVSVLCAGSLSG